MLFILAERRRNFQSLVVYKMRYMNALNQIKPNSISFNQYSINRRYSRTTQAEYGMHSLLVIPWNGVEKECKATSKNRQHLYEVFLWITHYWDDVVQVFILPLICQQVRNSFPFLAGIEVLSFCHMNTNT